MPVARVQQRPELNGDQRPAGLLGRRHNSGCRDEVPLGSRTKCLGRSKVQPWPNDVSPATHCIGLLPVTLREKGDGPAARQIETEEQETAMADEEGIEKSVPFLMPEKERSE